MTTIIMGPHPTKLVHRTPGGKFVQVTQLRGMDRKIARAMVRKAKQRRTGRYVWP